VQYNLIDLGIPHNIARSIKISAQRVSASCIAAKGYARRAPGWSRGAAGAFSLPDFFSSRFHFERVAVSTSAASTSGAAGRYASAIFDLGRENNALDTLEGDFTVLNTLISDSDDLGRMVSSPAYSRDDQQKAMTAVMSKAGSSDLTTRFVSLMVSKGRLGALPGAIQGFTELLADHRSETVAEVTSATPLTDAQRDALAANLKSSFGKDVKIDASVDPSLLGGLIVKVGSKMIDSSLKAKLNGLQLAMKAS